MRLPKQVDLPFFSYGLFRPGQIGYKRILPFVARPETEWHVKGLLLERDGLPVLDRGELDIPGALICFHDGVGKAAYEFISSIEPDKLDRWEVADVYRADYAVRANLLLGRKARRGSHRFDEAEWDGRKEPLFDAALKVVEETLEKNRE